MPIEQLTQTAPEHINEKMRELIDGHNELEENLDVLAEMIRNYIGIRKHDSGPSLEEINVAGKKLMQLDVRSRYVKRLWDRLRR